MGVVDLQKDTYSSETVGNKAFNLSKLHKAGIPTLQGLVITEPFQESDVEEAWARLSKLSPLAVRSSMIGEDGLEKSMAGKFATILGVNDKKSMADAIAEVFDSGKGCEGRAVLIQPMIDGQVSGVLFTTSPFNQDVSVIEAIYGLGELLVSGKVTPDHYQIDRNTKELVIEKHSEKQIYGLFLDKDNRSLGEEIGERIRIFAPMAGAKVLASIPYNRRHSRNLTDSQLKELIRIGDQIEELFLQPQDIEWCISKDGVTVLQTRPITTTIQTMCKEDIVEDEKVLHGIPASPGHVEGPVLRIEDAGTVTHYENYILVGVETDPSLLYAFSKAKGIVTENGGMLCHAAIVSRELGIPCVVGVEKVANQYETGDRISVNGNQGYVRRVG